jgi:transposase-like protein
VTLVRRSDGRVRFLVRENLEDVDENIVKYGDEDDSAILCTDQYNIYDEIEEYDEIDGHLAFNHDEHYVVGDALTTSCENRHSFLRNWLRRFRGASKHHLQDYLNSVLPNRSE